MKLVTQGEEHLCETATVYGQSEYMGIHAFASAANSMAAAGAVCLGAGADITYPLHSDKSVVYQMEKKLKKMCREREITLLETKIHANPLLSVPSVTVTMLGSKPGGGDADMKEASSKRIFTGGDIVQTKWIGMDGMLRIMQERGAELEKRFAPAFIRQILSHREALFSDKDAGVAKAMGVSVMRQITEGGIFAALWELAKECECGLSVNMKEMPILQETVEVCEHFRMNPYQLTSTGSFLMVTDDGEALADALRQEGTAAAVIGRLTDGRDKIITNGEDVRYLDRPAPDEIYKLFERYQARNNP